MQKILHPTEEGGLAIITATEEFLKTYTIEDLAAKDVPAGVPYILVDATDIPEDRTFRNAWEVDFSNPDGYGIGAEAWFAEQEEKKKQELPIDNNQPQQS